MNLQMIAFVCLLIGCIIRGVYPYLEKVASGENIDWSNQYTASIVIVCIISFAEAFVLLPTLIIKGETLAIVGSSFLLGWGQVDFINRLFVKNTIKKV